MGCQGTADQRQFPDFIMYCKRLVQIFIGALRPRAGEVEYDKANNTAHTDLLCAARNIVGKVKHVAEAGGSGSDHFRCSQFVAVNGKLRVYPARLGRPDMLVQPFHQR